MKLLGAGQPRTATTTQMIALEMLGLPCYHMRDMMMDLERSVPQWRKAFEGDGDWDEIFAGKESTVDWPAAWHYKELMELYPDAKVLLSVRSADSWVKSMESTITQIFARDTLMHHLSRAQYHIDPNYKGWIDLLTEMNFGEERGAWGGTNAEPDKMAEAYERWNQEVKDTVPADRLLVWDPKDGWEPLCEFLELPVPEQPLPHVNDTENFQKNLIMGPAIAAINAWWEENGPPVDEAANRPAQATA
jgi:hypothetical protein